MTATLGSLLKAAREKLGLTQAEVGEAVDTDGNNYSRYERDEITPPPRRREKLAKVLGLDLATIERAIGRLPPPKRVVEPDDRYPSRAILLRAARESGAYTAFVLEAVAEMRLKADADPGLAFWATQLDFFAKVEKEPPVAPAPAPAEPPKGALSRRRERTKA